MGRRVLLAASVAALVLPAGASAAKVKIEVLSNRADLLSGGDALVGVKLPANADASKVRVKLGKRTVTRQFAVRPNGKFQALLTGIPNRRIPLTATLPGARGARITLTGHPNGGPIFAGEQVQPWLCQETAVDTQCNQPAVYEFFGWTGSSFEKLDDPANPPESVGTTTTETGETVPFVIRIETGYQDRDQYKVAALYDPEQPWEPWAPQPTWNGKLVLTHGGSCGTDHKAGEAPDILRDQILGAGFIVASTALNNLGHNCNPVLITESEIMAKERIAEQYGPIKWTIGTGCSGGSIAQMGAAISYPGVYQGITVQCTFADLLTTGKHAIAGHLLQNLFVKNPLGGLTTPLDYPAVGGAPLAITDDAVFDAAFWASISGETGCQGMDPALKWSPENPSGVRCGVLDHIAAVTGRNADGYGAVPLDNVGVQYGLKSLLNGTLLPASFVDINARIGGVDKVTYLPAVQRTAADPGAIRNAYRSGLVSTYNTMDQTPILEGRGPNETTAHNTYPSLAINARLDNQFGTHANHVLWQGPVPLVGQSTYADRMVFAMDRWIAAIKADTSKTPLAKKIIADKPADIVDHCEAVNNVETPGTDCPAINRFYESPTNTAGESIRGDILKCQLKPLRREDYGNVLFTDAQWATLNQAFPGGVCDWDKPGVEQTKTIPWLTYAKKAGGQRMGPAPKSQSLARRRR